MKFVKMHGLGNDFVIMDARHGEKPPVRVQMMALADRRTGIGCDQFIVLGPGKKGDVFMRIYNPDGGEAESCGNATRCVASLLMKETKKDRAVVETVAGLLECWREKDGRITTDMGVPKVETEDLSLAGGNVKAVGVNIGNPHAVLFMKEVDHLDIQKLGPPLENDPKFPDKANIEFVEVKSPAELRMRVWERGAGETLACGSGACAAVAAAVHKGLTGRKVRVILDGGPMDFEWRESDDHILMTGAVAHVFDGMIKDL